MECSGVKRTVFPEERFVESDARKEQWIYTLAPVITGKSGISHEFDFAFTKADESGDIITCSIIPSNAKDTLSLIDNFLQCPSRGCGNRPWLFEKNNFHA